MNADATPARVRAWVTRMLLVALAAWLVLVLVPALAASRPVSAAEVRFLLFIVATICVQGMFLNKWSRRQELGGESSSSRSDLRVALLVILVTNALASVPALRVFRPESGATILSGYIYGVLVLNLALLLGLFLWLRRRR